jgi:hypothetical protein
MSVSLVLILWPSSVFFTAVLSFRVGAWWKTTELHGRHAVGSLQQTDGPWADDEGLDFERKRDDASQSGRPPASSVRWWSEEDDTEKLPRIEDTTRDELGRD